MEKMTIRKMLEKTVVATSNRQVKKIYLVSTDGEIIESDFAVDLVQKLARWNFLWEVNVISAKFYDDYFTVIFNDNVEQVNGDPDKGNTWL